MAHQAEEDVSLSSLSRIPAGLVASSVTSVGSLASDTSERKNTRRRKMTELPGFLLLGSGHLKRDHPFRISLFDRVLFMFLRHHWISLNSVTFQLWVQLLLDN